MKPKYFWSKAAGLNADIDRHTEEEHKLKKKIEEIQGKKELTKTDKSLLAAFSHYLKILLASKAEVASKIGKQK